MILDTRLAIAAVDFTDEGWQDTIAHAAHHARTREVGVHLVHAVQKTPWLLRKVLDDDSVTSLENEQRQSAERRLSDACATLKEGGVEASFEVRTGKPSTEILGAVTKKDAGLLVIGRGTTTSATAMLVGGTADRLLRASPIPVLVRGPNAPADIRHILVPTGLGPSGSQALARAAKLVDPEQGGTVSAMHMVSLPGIMRAYSGDVNKLRAAVEAQARQELEAHVSAIGAAHVSPVLRPIQESQTPDQLILAYARAHEVDLICLALGGRAFTTGPMIGRVSQRVIRALPCPLLALPDAWIDQKLGR